MTPPELQRALAQMPSRAAQTLTFFCLEGRSPGECAALYGIGLPQWDVLFFEAARAFAGEHQPLPDPDRAALAQRLQQALAGAPDPQLAPLVSPLRSLIEHRAEVQRLLVEAEKAAAASPARAREGWLRRVAVAAIIGVSLFVWLRERNKPPPTPTQFPLPPPGVR